MIRKKSSDITSEEVPGLSGVTKKILIGPREDSQEIIMRSFRLKPGSSTPYHSHDFPHVVKIEKGQGLVVDSQGSEFKLEQNDVVYVSDNEIHGFKNKGSEPFEFICIVPNRGEK